MQGGTKNQLSINMSNVKHDIRRGCTQGMEPHQYTDVEMERLRKRREALAAEVHARGHRGLHPASSFDMCIEYTNDAATKLIHQGAKRKQPNIRKRAFIHVANHARQFWWRSAK